MTPQLDQLFSFLRFPSISTDSRHAGDVRACAAWLLAKLQAMGLSADLLSARTGGADVRLTGCA